MLAVNPYALQHASEALKGDKEVCQLYFICCGNYGKLLQGMRRTAVWDSQRSIVTAAGQVPPELIHIRFGCTIPGSGGLDSPAQRLPQVVLAAVRVPGVNKKAVLESACMRRERESPAGVRLRFARFTSHSKIVAFEGTRRRPCAGVKRSSSRCTASLRKVDAPDRIAKYLLFLLIDILPCF